MKLTALDYKSFCQPTVAASTTTTPTRLLGKTTPGTTSSAPPVTSAPPATDVPTFATMGNNVARQMTLTHLTAAQPQPTIATAPTAATPATPANSQSPNLVPATTRLALVTDTMAPNNTSIHPAAAPGTGTLMTRASVAPASTIAGVETRPQTPVTPGPPPKQVATAVGAAVGVDGRGLGNTLAQQEHRKRRRLSNMQKFRRS